VGNKEGSAVGSNIPGGSLIPLLPAGHRALRTVFVLGLLLLFYTLWSVWLATTGSPTIDFFTFWTVPQTLSHQPVGNIYSEEGQRKLALSAAEQAGSPHAPDLQKRTASIVLQLYNGRVDATASPLLYAAVGGLSSGDYLTDQKRFLFVSMACMILSVLILAKMLRFAALEIILLLLFLFWNFEPLLSDMRVGNVNELQLFAIVLFIFLSARSRPLSAGLVLGLTTAFKPTTAMVLVLVVVAGLADRGYAKLAKTLAGAAAGIGLSVSLSAVYFGDRGMWLDFLHSLPKTLNGTAYSLESGNFSLAALVFGATSRRAVIIPAALLALFCWILASSGRSSDSPAGNAARAELDLQTAFCIGGCGCAIMLLSSPLVWLQYYLLLLPLLLYVISADRAEGGSEVGKPSIAWRQSLPFLPYLPLVLFSLPFHMVVGRNLRLLCIFIILASILTLALAAQRIWSGRRGPDPAPGETAFARPASPPAANLTV